MKLTTLKWNEGRQWDVEMKCRSWAVAGYITTRAASDPPAGYKLAWSTTKPRSATGSRTNLHMRFFLQANMASRIQQSGTQMTEHFRELEEIGRLGLDESGKPRLPADSE